MSNYKLQTRYEYWAMSGKTWTKWYTPLECCTVFDNETDAKEAMKKCKQNVKFYDDKTHTKTEYKIIEIL